MANHLARFIHWGLKPQFGSASARFSVALITRQCGFDGGAGQPADRQLERRIGF